MAGRRGDGGGRAEEDTGYCALAGGSRRPTRLWGSREYDGLEDEKDSPCASHPDTLGSLRTGLALRQEEGALSW